MFYDIGLSVIGRVLLDENVFLIKVEVSGGWYNECFGVSVFYVWFGEDVVENCFDIFVEWNLDSSYWMICYWIGLVNWCFDVVGNCIIEVGFGLEYCNECVKV